ncbi:MAG: Calx-beta domain-containing protein, partial [Verrucomicrobiota bacterium]
MNTSSLVETMNGQPARRRPTAALARLALLASGWVLAQASLNAQSPGRPDPGTGDAGGETSPPQPLALTLDYPRLEVAENRAYIPLFFTVRGTPPEAGDIRVRATFAGGTATPGEDFDLGEGVRVVPAQGGLNSVNWVEVPLLLDEANEGDETAWFDLSIEGSTAAPLRMEVVIKDDLAVGEVGFISPRFSASEGAPGGKVVVRLWRTLNTRNAATVTYRLEGAAAALASLGGEATRTAVFQPGESQIFVGLPIVNDTEAQGSRDLTLVIESSSDGMKPMKGFEKSVLTLADDETKPEAAPLEILEGSSEGGERGVVLTTRVPRGYQVRLEYSDAGVEGP